MQLQHQSFWISRGEPLCIVFLNQRVHENERIYKPKGTLSQLSHYLVVSDAGAAPEHHTLIMSTAAIFRASVLARTSHICVLLSCGSGIRNYLLMGFVGLRFMAGSVCSCSKKTFSISFDVVGCRVYLKYFEFP